MEHFGELTCLQLEWPRVGFLGKLSCWCTDTSDLRHFRPKTFRCWCRSVQCTIRHKRKNLRHFGTMPKCSGDT